MTARKKTSPKTKSSVARKRRQARKQSHALNFEALESRQLLAAVTVGNATDILSPTADTSSIAALVANDGGDGISLREAIAAANNTAGEDSITFDAGVFTSDNNLIRLTQGQLSISDSLTVDGSSVGGVVITGDANGDDITVAGTNITDVAASFGGIFEPSDDLLDDNSRVLDFSANAGSLTLTDLTITGGRLTDISQSGAGIRSVGNLSLINSDVNGNSTIANFGNGAGIFSSSGDVSLTNSTVRENSAARYNSHGGGIFISDGDVSLIDSAVSENSLMGSENRGGGIYVSNGNAFLSNSTVSDNIISNTFISNNDNRGGGIYIVNGDVSLINSAVTGNESFRSSGGGISSTNGNVSLTNSTISGNSSVNNSGGGISNNNGDVSLISSTVSGNIGGGIRSSRGNLSLTSSTISGNSSNSISRYGGGISSVDSTVQIINSTVTANSAYREGGGISFTVNPSVVAGLSIQNSIVAGNTTSRSESPDLRFSDRGDASDFVVEYSLIGDTDDSGISATTGVGNILNTSALLGPLADNGGLTQTHALLLDSPAINTGDDALAVDESGNPLTTDQRGENRFFGAVDIGAFELQVEGNVETRSLVVTTNQDIVDPDDGLNSLREAIEFANDPTSGRGRDGDADGDGSVSDAITFDPGVFTGEDNNLIRLTQGELVITQSASIDGSLVGGVLITGDAANDDVTVGSTHITDVSASYGGTAGAEDDLLDDNSRVLNSFGTLALTGLTITGGRSTGSFSIGRGGGIYANGNLSLTNTTVSGNRSSSNGGGVFSYTGELSLTDSTVSGNRSDTSGGGIASDSRTATVGNVLLNNSTVRDNSSGSGGGGIVVSGSYSLLSLTNSTLSGNSSAGPGGGIFKTGRLGDVLLTNSTISDNQIVGGQGDGGGIYSFFSDVTLIGSTVSGNSSTGSGGGIELNSFRNDLILDKSTVSGNSSVDGGGGIRAGDGDVFLTDSTVSGNYSNGSGGGIDIDGGNVSITNSTVSGNGSQGDGGGISNRSGAVSLINSTVTGNSADGAGGGVSDSFNSGDRLTIHNSIIAGNTDDGTAPNLNSVRSLLELDVENSLIGDTTGSAIALVSGNGNNFNQAALLGPLADNGGPTQTHSLLPGSLAINTGSNELTDAAGLTADQRGEGRIQFGTVDIGAFESNFNERNLVVTTNLDVEDPNDGLTSLREAIIISNEGSETSTITFDSSVFGVPTTIEISSQLPTITDTLTITGAHLVIIDALGGGDNVLDGDGFRIFEVNDGDLGNSVDVSISGLTLTGGDSNDSGGAINNLENLTLDGVAIVGNRANSGGGVSNELSGVLTLSNSTIANNEASQDGGGIFTGGELSAANLTISGNGAAGKGGAIASAGDSSGGMLRLTNATLTNNTGNAEVYFNSSNGPAFATFNNTIIDGLIVGVGNNGATLTGSNNLFAGADPGIAGTGNLFNQTSMLGVLADNGGPTLTHTLLYGSPAFNAGDITLAVDENGNPLTTDQRGQDRIRFGAIDIGAVETEFGEARSLVVTTALDVEDASDGFTSLREAIAFAFEGFSGDGDADGDGLRADTITFDASVFTGGENSVIRLTQGELSISDNLTIDGSLVGGVVLTGDATGDDILVVGTHVTDVSASLGGTDGTSTNLLDDNSRVFNILDSDLFGAANVNLRGLTITGGQATGGEHGGGIQFISSGTLTLNQSAVSGNSATGFNANGGGIYVRSGDALLLNSLVSGNVSSGNGGGISIVFGRFASSNSTVSGNISGGGGGGIWFSESPIQFVNSTVTDNSAARVGGGISFRDSNSSQAVSLTLLNSIVSGNTDNGTAPDVEDISNVANEPSVEHSLIGDTTGSGITTTSGTGNILNQAAFLGPLADNGGPTLTHALLSNSLAINAGSNAFAITAGLTADQRGESRIQFGTVDIGAVESEFEAPILLGDVNLDGDVDFLDISPLILLLSSSTFLDEADINRDGSVDFLDISPFILLLSTVGPAAATSQFIAVPPPVSSMVSLAVSEPVSIVSAASTVSAPVATETLDAKQVDAYSAKVSQGIAATEPLPQTPLVLVSDSLASPVAQANNLSVVDTTVTSVTSADTYRRPAVLALTNHSSLEDRTTSLRDSESSRPFVKPLALTGNAESVDFSLEPSDTHSTAKVVIEESFSTAAELFDAHPESLDEVFDFEIESTLQGLI